jgi:hypothetical protein
MNKAEVGDLLTVIVAFDRRTIGHADIEVWHLILADYPLADCAQAVKDHYSERTDWLMPAHVVARADRMAKHHAYLQRVAELEAEDAAETRALEAAIAADPPPNLEQLRQQAETALANGVGRPVPRTRVRHPRVPDAVRRELDARRANIPGSENPPADPTDPEHPMAGQTRKADR